MNNFRTTCKLTINFIALLNQARQIRQMTRLKSFLASGLIISQTIYAADSSKTREIEFQNGSLRILYTMLQKNASPPGLLSSREIFVMVFDDEVLTTRLSDHFRHLEYKPSYTTHKTGFNVGLVFAGKAEDKQQMPTNTETSEASRTVNVSATAMNVASLVVAAGVTKLIGFGPLERIPLFVTNPIRGPGRWDAD